MCNILVPLWLQMKISLSSNHCFPLKTLLFFSVSRFFFSAFRSLKFVLYILVLGWAEVTYSLFGFLNLGVSALHQVWRFVSHCCIHYCFKYNILFPFFKAFNDTNVRSFVPISQVSNSMYLFQSIFSVQIL